MLDTLLQIGKTLRKSGHLRHHRYIKLAPEVELTITGNVKTDVIYLNLPVREDFTFNFDKLDQNFHNENIIPDFYYLTYKSADADSSVKYLWGDISYFVDKDGKETGSYRIAENKNAFLRANKDESFFSETLIKKFRESFAENRERIENLLKENSQEKFCYLHFDFQGESKHWYQFKEEFEALNNKFLQEFIGDKQNGEVVLRKGLYKTLASPEKNLPFPDFSALNIYKTRTFERNETEDQILDLIYAINYSTKAAIFDNDIKIIILPKSKYLTAEKIEEFFEPNQENKSQKNRTLTARSESERLLEKAHNKQQKKALKEIDLNAPDELLQRALQIQPKENEEIEFDFIFSKAGGMTAPDVDMIELSGIKQSYLANLSNKIIEVRNDVFEKRKNLFPNSELQSFDIRRSFMNILGDFSKSQKSKNKKYQSHLLKVLPQIYSGNYYRDDVLLPAFIEKIQYETRNQDEGQSKWQSPFNFLKFDYEFLVNLRSSFGDKNGEKEMTKMKDNINYKIGLLLGHLAQPVSRDINTFEKGYVGLLLRHISDLKGLVKLANFINSKLAIHGRVANKVRKRSTELENVIGKINLESLPNFADLSLKLDSMVNEINEKQFDIEFCAFGFFEGYFSKYLKSQDDSSTEGEN